MRPKEYCEYINNPLAEAKARVLIVSSGECWTMLRRFYQERDCCVLRLSELVTEDAWLPMPDEVFNRVCVAMTSLEVMGKCVVVLGLPGYLALLTDENRRGAMEGLRRLVDSSSRQESVYFLRGDDGMGLLLSEVFANPRYRQGKQLIEIDVERSVSQLHQSSPTEVTIVGADLASYIPESCETFPKYLLHTEDDPFDSVGRRIVVASKGRELAGLRAEVRQVVCLREFARLFYDVDEAGISVETLKWMCEQGKQNPGNLLREALKTFFFPEGGLPKYVLRKFDGCRNSVECGAMLWLVKNIAPKDGYLNWVASQEGVTISNFRSAYVTAGATCLERAPEQIGERRTAILEADARRSDAAIRQFIASCKSESTSRVAPWLNCGTDAERAELLRRCRVDGVVLNVVKDVYPEVAAYLNPESVFDNDRLEDYFREYRELKMAGRVTPEFCAKAKQLLPLSFIKSRDELLQQYASDEKCALLVVDAMGAEWLPMILAMAPERNLGVESAAVGLAHLPTATRFNCINWGDPGRRLPDIKRFDNIAHRGVEAHETRPAEENLCAALDVIGSEVLLRVADGLARFDRVLVTADHGSSRLAVLAWQSEPRLAQTLVFKDGAEIADWRYRERVEREVCPQEVEEPLDGKHWVIRGYDRFPKKGGGQGFELHGGATLEERLVPVVVFSMTGQFKPKAKADGKRPQIIENDDFDL